MPTRCKISTVYPDLPGFPATCHSQGQHLEAVKRRAYSFAGGQDGLNLDQFEQLCREMMSELYGKLAGGM
eukprot:symbB.v1.2.005888.t1/scaffold345.1/size224439/13